MRRDFSLLWNKSDSIRAITMWGHQPNKIKKYVDRIKAEYTIFYL